MLPTCWGQEWERSGHPKVAGGKNGSGFEPVLRKTEQTERVGPYVHPAACRAGAWERARGRGPRGSLRERTSVQNPVWSCGRALLLSREELVFVIRGDKSM